jgi:hypothetical protein
MKNHAFSPLRFALRLAVLSLCGLSFTLAGCGSSTPSASGGGTGSGGTTAYAAGRSIWLWDNAAVANHSASTIVNTPSLQAGVISFLKTWKITTVYGSYSTALSTNPAGVRAWNQLLAANGIHSYYLVSQTTYFLPEGWAAAQNELQTNVLNFNAASTAAQSFTGVALDVEPDAFAGSSSRTSWSAATAATRRTYVTYFLNFLQSTRALLNSNGGSNLSLETSLTYWYVQMDGTIGWSSQSDVSQWMSSMGQTVNLVSIMDYSSNTQSLIQSRYTQNSTLLPAGATTIALRYPGTEWSSLSQFWTALQTAESTNTIYCDIEDYDTFATAEGF